MDLVESLVSKINVAADLPIICDIGYLRPEESLVAYPLPGSKIERAYYDGTKDQTLNYEFAMKSCDQKKIHDTLWNLQNYLEELDELESSDGSFSFDCIEITNKPFINQLDDKGNFIFLLDVLAKVTTF